MRWLDCITDSMDMNLGILWEMVRNREAWSAAVHGILQASILEWVAISFSRDLPNPGTEVRSPTLQADSLPLSQQGSPFTCCSFCQSYGFPSSHVWM